MGVNKTFYITGNDTGVGKTVFTALFIRYLRAIGCPAHAIKPLCSGGRADARMLWAAQGRTLSLATVNPWCFRAAITPLLAGRKAGVMVGLREVVSHITALQPCCEVLLVEGAGGLLSPLGEGYSNRELLLALQAVPVIVCPNRLGSINQVLLVLAALPKKTARQAQIVLVSQKKPDASASSNLALLKECLGASRVFALPWLSDIKPDMPRSFKPDLKELFGHFVPVRKH